MVEICGACGYRSVSEDSESGWCEPCDRNRVSEEYAEKDRKAVDGRREQWRARSPAQRHWDTLRQQRHRTLVKVRPLEPAPEMPDPLRLAEEGINALERIRLSVRNANALDLLDRTEEIVRRLGWGADDEPERKAAAELESKWGGWDGQWRHIG